MCHMGSPKGPLLFIIFVNDIPHHISSGVTHLYADDTAITVTANNQLELENKLTTALMESKSWMEGNKLTLNTSKIKAMTFGTNYTINQITDPIIKHQDLETNSNRNRNLEINSYKYLGVC